MLRLLLCAALLLPTGTFVAQGGTPKPAALRDAYADVNGVRLHYRIGGRGPALVLLHGLTMSSAWWNGLAPGLTREHTVIVPDLRGHGESTNPSGRFRGPEVAVDVLSLVDLLGIREFSLVGHSAGANASLHIAARAPDRVRSMMLIAFGHRVTNDARTRWANFPPVDSLPPQYRKYYAQVHPGGRAQIDQVLGYLRHFADNAEDVNLPRDLVARIKAPTLVVFGDRDFSPVEIATELYRLLPNTQLWIVPNTGHTPVWTDWDGNPAAAAMFPTVVKTFFAPQRTMSRR